MNSAFASRIADATAEVRFLRPTTSVAAPFRNTAQVCAASSHWMRYSTLDVLRESRGRALETDEDIDWLVGIAKHPEILLPVNLELSRQLLQSGLMKSTVSGCEYLSLAILLPTQIAN